MKHALLPALAFLLVTLAAFRPGEENFSVPLHIGGWWIFLHVALALAAYAALVVSLLASLLYLIQERRLKSKSGRVGRLATLDTPLETIDQIKIHGRPLQPYERMAQTMLNRLRRMLGQGD